MGSQHAEIVQMMKQIRWQRKQRKSLKKKKRETLKFTHGCVHIETDSRSALGEASSCVSLVKYRLEKQPYKNHYAV